jgi:hypothetical protein
MQEIVGDASKNQTNINEADDEADKPLIDGSGDFEDSEAIEYITQEKLDEMKGIHEKIEKVSLWFNII